MRTLLGIGRESWDMVQSGGVGWREREKIHPYEINRSMFSGLSLTNVLGNHIPIKIEKYEIPPLENFMGIVGTIQQYNT